MATPSDVAALYQLQQRLERDLEAVRRALELLGEAPIHTLKETPSTQPPEFAGMGPQEALERLLQANPSHKYTAREAASELKNRGVISKSKTFVTSVGSALHRMAGKGLAEKTRKGKRVAFIWRKNADSDSAGTASESKS